MARKEFTYRGKSLEELKTLSINEFAELLPARQRRSLKKGLTETQKTFVRKLEKKGTNVKTHCRDMIILPKMVGKIIRIYNGKEYVALTIEDEMIGHFMGEFAQTRRGVSHSAPGVGATRSSASISVR